MDYIKILNKCVLFDSFEDEEIISALNCIKSQEKKYSKDETVLLAGNSLSKIGIVLEGSLIIKREDSEGNSVIIEKIDSSDLFGEAFACAQISNIPVTVESSSKSVVLFLDYHKIVNFCPNACSFHSKLINNMFKIMAKKLILLNKKIEILSKKSIREKILAYFEDDFAKNDVSFLTYTKSEFAEYLCVNRSALSRELTKMQEEGIIYFEKNKFFKSRGIL